MNTFDLPDPTRRRLLAAAVLTTCSGGLRAQPGASVGRIIVPFAAGGAREMPARIVQHELKQETGINWIIENKPGAGGAIGTVFVGRSAPDGMTLLMAASSHFVTAAMGAKPHYDPVKDFVPVANFGDQNYVLIVQAAMRVNNAGELIALAKQQPGAMNYGSAGLASSTHLAGAYFCSMAGIEMMHIPYKSTQEAANDVVGGRCHFTFVPTAGVGPYVSDPRVKVIGITSPQPSPMMPGVAAISQSGLKGYEFESWFGLLAPAKTPPDVVARLNAAVNKASAKPEIREQLKRVGIDPKPMSPSDFNKLFLADRDLMARVVKASGITKE